MTTSMHEKPISFLKHYASVFLVPTSALPAFFTCKGRQVDAMSRAEPAVGQANETYPHGVCETHPMDNQPGLMNRMYSSSSNAILSTAEFLHFAGAVNGFRPGQENVRCRPFPVIRVPRPPGEGGGGGRHPFSFLKWGGDAWVYPLWGGDAFVRPSPPYTTLWATFSKWGEDAWVHYLWGGDCVGGSPPQTNCWAKFPSSGYLLGILHQPESMFWGAIPTLEPIIGRHSPSSKEGGGMFVYTSMCVRV